MSWIVLSPKSTIPPASCSVRRLPAWRTHRPRSPGRSRLTTQSTWPVLCFAGQEFLDDETLIEGAKTKGQEHLLAISQRTRLSEGVTDVLVERGNQKVIISTAANAGARSLSSATPPWSRDLRTIPSLRCWFGTS